MRQICDHLGNKRAIIVWGAFVVKELIQNVYGFPLNGYVSKEKADAVFPTVSSSARKPQGTKADPLTDAADIYSLTQDERRDCFNGAPLKGFTLITSCDLDNISQSQVSTSMDGFDLPDGPHLTTELSETVTELNDFLTTFCAETQQVPVQIYEGTERKLSLCRQTKYVAASALPALNELTKLPAKFYRPIAKGTTAIQNDDSF